eukprot:3932221-Rhodomonas_salina.1
MRMRFRTRMRVLRISGGWWMVHRDRVLLAPLYLHPSPEQREENAQRTAGKQLGEKQTRQGCSGLGVVRVKSEKSAHVEAVEHAVDTL